VGAGESAVVGEGFVLCKNFEKGGVAMRLIIGNNEISAYSGLIVSLERFNSPYPSRRLVRMRYHNSGKERSYNYKELVRTGAAIASIQDSTFKQISFGQLWEEGGNWEWVLIVENERYRLVYESHDPLTLDMDALRNNKWYKALKPFLGEFATTGLIALEFDGLIGVEKKSECQEVSHELTQTEAS
jgi:hypothetical protein